MVSNEIRTLPPVGTDNWYGVGLFVTKPPQNSATWKNLTHMVKHKRSSHKRRMRSGGFRNNTQASAVPHLNGAPDQFANSW